MNINTPSEIIETAMSTRTCPPPDKRSGKNWEIHIKRCAQCRENANEPWEELAGHLKQFFNSKPENSNPCEGDLWQIDPEKGKWVSADYLTPPVVFVAEIRGNGTAGCYMVYPDTDTAGPGDIILDGDETDFCDVLVETWNRISVKTSDFSLKLGSVSANVLKDIRKHAEDPRFIPSWAEVPLSIKNANDPRNAFRKIERRVAAVFSMTPLETLFEKTSVFFDMMKNILPETSPLPSGKGVTEAILSFGFPSGMAPAHAQSADKRIPAQWRTMILKDESLVNYFPSNAKIESDETSGGRRVITGQSHVPHGADVFRLVACLSLPSGMLTADVAILDGDGSFSAEFDVKDAEGSVAASPLFCAIYEQTV